MTDGVPARGSLRSRGAAAVSTYTLRPITSVIPPERAWGLWLSRQIIARIMGTFGPSLAGTRVESVDVKCELQLWPHQVHVFQALPRMTPEAAKAMAYVARFIAHALQDARAVTEEAH